MRHQAAERWGVLDSLLRQLGLLRRRHKAPVQQEKTMSRLLTEVDLVMLEVAAHFNRTVTVEMAEAWALLIRGADECPLDELAILEEETTEFAAAS